MATVLYVVGSFTNVMWSFLDAVKSMIDRGIDKGEGGLAEDKQGDDNGGYDGTNRRQERCVQLLVPGDPTYLRWEDGMVEIVSQTKDVEDVEGFG